MRGNAGVLRAWADGRRQGALLAAAALMGALGAASPAGAAELGQRAFALDGNALVSFDLRRPSAVTTTALTGVSAGDDLVAVAVRPQNTMLYALGVNQTAKTYRLYAIARPTNTATPVGAAFQFTESDGVTVSAPTGTNWGMAFSPTSDRVRVVTNTGRNFRINATTGAGIDTDANAVNGVNSDSAISGAASGVDATAYASPNANAVTSTQYTLASSTDALYLQAPPNNGIQTHPVPLTQGGAPYDVGSAKGLAFLPSAPAPAANDQPIAGTAYAALRTNGSTHLATIDVTSGAVTDLGPIGTGGEGLHGLAILAERAPGSRPAIALTGNGTTLTRFDVTSPGTTTTQGLNTATVTSGESIVGIARRPSTGQYYALGINPSNSTGTLYLLDPQSGVLSAVGSASQIAFKTSGGATISLSSSAFALSFNPTVDRLRVVASSGLNFRVNPTTGAPVDGDSVANLTQPDGTINGLPSTGATGIVGAAYTDSYAGATSTTLYTVHANSDSLFIQNPPNNGNQTSQLPVMSNAAAVDFVGSTGLDIGGEVAAPSSNAPTTGTAYAATGSAGFGTLYSLDLATGAATNLGRIGAGVAVTGLVIGELAPAFFPLVDGDPGPSPTPTPTATPTPTPVVVTTPELRALTAAAKKLRTGKRPKGASKKVTTGTTLAVDVSEASTLEITVAQQSAGKRSGSKCVKPTAKLKKAKGCTRLTAKGIVTAAVPAGKSTVKFTGKVAGKTLKPGDYQLTVIAKNALGKVSTARTVKLSVVR